LIDDVKKHNDNILRAIQTEIAFNGKKIKIDRSNIIGQITQHLDIGKNIIISGEGGCGKTAIFREFYDQKHKNIPICIFKATELNVGNVNNLFRFVHIFSFTKFLDAYKSEPKKIFVIDSAEKLAELTNNDVLNNLIFTLKDNSWTLVFTTRYSYLNDLSFHIKENYQLSCEIIDITTISDDELTTITTENNITLPDNQNFLERLKNLFYLNEYFKEYDNINKQGNFRGFIDLIWKKRIQNFAVQKDNLHIEREKCIIEITKERCNSGKFYISINNLPQTALFQLKQDEVLGYDETHNGYFITHDIYEEWALNRIISRLYANHINSKQFIDELGDSLPIRRAFRLWLSEHLSENINKVEDFIKDIFTNETVPQFWKDELLISVLLSDYANTFFQQFNKEIASDDFTLLKRMLFLLRIACKEEDEFLSKLLKTASIDYLFTKPKGKGWDEAIKFIYSNKDNLFECLDTLIPLLEDWNNNIKRGNITRFSTLSALHFYESVKKSDSYYGEKKNQLISIILEGALEIKDELNLILETVIQNKWKNHSDPHYDLCHTILTSNKLAIIFALPEQILKLADLFWFDTEKQQFPFAYSSFGVEQYYSINEHCHHDYFPASAMQTPIYWLLESSTNKTIDFILNFTNKAVENYAKSDVGDTSEFVDVIINGNTVIKQYANQTIWCMYRGCGGITKPYLLESMHMALEKFLLKLAKEAKINIVESCLIHLIQHSKSASITAIVASVILAYPEKYYNIAMILFKTLKFFHFDGIRQQQESQAKYLYGIGYGLNKTNDVYADERLKTCEDKHRTSSLESLIVNYQFFEIKDASVKDSEKLIRDIYEIIDCHHKRIEAENNNDPTIRILLSRIDRRNMKPSIKDTEDGNMLIELNPQLTPDIEKHSKQAMERFDNMLKYTPLKLWSDFIHNKNLPNTSEKYKQYADNPLSALEEVKQLIEDLKNTSALLLPMDEVIPSFVCSKLIIEYSEKLSKEDKDFCKEIIFSSVSRLFADEYNYQISDGVEASVHAMPFLMSEYPDYKEDIILIMILSLFDETPIGNKRICDYAIESIHESKLWKSHPDDAQAILLGFIKLKPIYNQSYNEKRKEKGLWGRISRTAILQDFESKVTEQLGDLSFANVSFDINDIDSFDIHDLEIVYQLIPSNTNNVVHLEIYKNSLPKTMPKLLINRHQRKNEYFGDSNLYSVRLHIFRRYAYFILERDMTDMDNYLQSFITSFIATEETSSLLDEIISAEDNNNKYEQFWYVWNKLYPKFVEICNNSHGFHLNKVIISYLLAWQWWREGVEGWHSLKEENLPFYANVAKNLGCQPSVLYSIAKILNSIGSEFTKEGIDWIYAIVSINKSIKLGDLESNTLYYMERFMRKFIFMNKKQIKQEIRLKNKVIPILEFMIEHGSVQGYLLREDILKFKSIYFRNETAFLSA
jgi:hypothetical protein